MSSPIDNVIRSRWKKVTYFNKEHPKDKFPAQCSISPEWTGDNTYEITLKGMKLEECHMIISSVSKSLKQEKCFSCDQSDMKYETGLCEECHVIAMSASKALEEKE